MFICICGRNSSLFLEGAAARRRPFLAESARRFRPYFRRSRCAISSLVSPTKPPRANIRPPKISLGVSRSAPTQENRDAASKPPGAKNVAFGLLYCSVFLDSVSMLPGCLRAQMLNGRPLNFETRRSRRDREIRTDESKSAQRYRIAQKNRHPKIFCWGAIDSYKGRHRNQSETADHEKCELRFYCGSSTAMFS